MAARVRQPILPPGNRHGRSFGRAWTGPVLVLAEGGAMAIVLAMDGSPLWRVVRAVIAVSAAILAAWLMHRSGRASRGAVALVAGIVGTVTGAGVATGYAARAGAPVVTIAALVALLAGVILLVWGGAALVRAMPGWWRLLAVPAVLAIGVFVLVPLTFAVNATNRPADSREPMTPASRGLAYRDAAMRTSDGVLLAAWYLPSRNGAAVVLLPGAGSTRSTLLGHAAVLARHGYGALLVDTAGTGAAAGMPWTSGGTATGTSLPPWRSWGASTTCGPAGFAVLGLSMGGEQALVAAGSDPRIRAVVAESVTGEQLADHGWLPQGPDGMISRGLEWVMYTGAGLMSGTAPPMYTRDAIRAAVPRPELIIAAAAVPDEPVAARWFQAAAPASVRVWVAPGAGPHRRAGGRARRLGVTGYRVPRPCPAPGGSVSSRRRARGLLTSG